MMIGYVSVGTFEGYAAARGLAVQGDPEILLLKGLDWLELQPFSGSKTSSDQDLEFPRNGSKTVPDKIKTAQMEAALVYDSGGDLLAAIGPRLIMESVGVIQQQFSDRGNQTTLYPRLEALLRDYVGGVGGLRVERA